MQRETFSSVDVLRAVLTLDEKLWDEALLAVWAAHSVIRQVLSEQAEKLFFTKRCLTVLALLLQFDIERAFHDLA